MEKDGEKEEKERGWIVIWENLEVRQKDMGMK